MPLCTSLYTVSLHSLCTQSLYTILVGQTRLLVCLVLRCTQVYLTLTHSDTLLLMWRFAALVFHSHWLHLDDAVAVCNMSCPDWLHPIDAVLCLVVIMLMLLLFATCCVLIGCILADAVVIYSRSGYDHLLTHLLFRHAVFV